MISPSKSLIAKSFLLCGGAIAILGLSACQTSSVAYQKPALETPASWQASGAGQPDAVAQTEWWNDWRDPVLNQLMQTAITQNLDVKLALARVDEARALSKVNDGHYKPNLYFDGGATAQGGLRSEGGLNNSDGRLKAGVGMSWTPDLYGLGKLETQLGQAGLQAADSQYRGAVNALLAEVANAYVDLRLQQQTLALLEKNIELQSETLKVVRIQTAAGAGVKLDVLRAEAQVESTRSQLPGVMAAIQIDCNRLAVLLGETPGARDAALKPHANIPVFASTIGLDSPASIIANRPDVRNAEYQLEQQAVLKSLRSADLFPKVTLSSFLGLSTSSLFGTSAPVSLIGGLTRPLLDYGVIQHQIDAQSARQQQAFFGYKQTVLLAVEDVERSLISYGQEQQRLTNLTKTSEIQIEAARQARLKYKAGYATFLDVLIAEQQLLDVQLAQSQSRARLAAAGVDVYTALGSGVGSQSPVLASR